VRARACAGVPQAAGTKPTHAPPGKKTCVLFRQVECLLAHGRHVALVAKDRKDAAHWTSRKTKNWGIPVGCTFKPLRGGRENHVWDSRKILFRASLVSVLASLPVQVALRDPQSSRRWDAKTNGHHVTSLNWEIRTGHCDVYFGTIS